MTTADGDGSSTARTARLRRGVVAAAVVALVALAWWWGEQWEARRSALAAFPTTEGEIFLSGLEGRVGVVRDGRGIPRIDATSELDGWAALGFCHAQDRLAQMFWLRRLARGRTAEVVGERGLRADRVARTLGIGAHADAEVARLDSETRRVLDAYASGINSRMERIRQGLVAAPLEIAAAADLTEPWSAGDSLAVVKLMAWSAGPAPETALVLWDIVDRLGAVAARPFMPTGIGVRGADTAVRLPPPESPAAAGTPDPWQGSSGTALADAALNSTAWVVAGSLTRSGAPILAVDFHLAPTVPSLVYEAQIRAGALYVAGATVPGAPVFWAGRNRDLAWGATPARIMTTDLYRETPNPENPAEYRHGRRWVQQIERSEIIGIAGVDGPARTETLRVRETRHGPIVNDLLGRSGAPLALAWSGSLPGNGVTAMLGVARAADVRELREALGRHHEPVIALLYADSAGAVGLQVAGWVPRRRLPSGLVPVPGRQTVFDWPGAIKPEDLPHLSLADDQDWLVASDAPLIDSLGGRIEWLWRTGEAAARLESRLNAISQAGVPAGQREPLDASGLAGLRPERWSLRSREVVAVLVELAGDPDTLAPEEREILELLARWDGRIWSGSRGAAAEHLVFHHLTRELFTGPFGSERLRAYLALSHTRPKAVAEKILLAAAVFRGRSDRSHRSGRPGWPEPERVRGAIRASLGAAWMSLSLRFGDDRQHWQWGGLTNLAFRPFAREGRFEAVADDTRRQLRDLRGTPSVADMSALDPFAVETTTSYRLVMDLASPDHLLSALAPGQSEHPQHPHFDDGIDAFHDGGARQFAMGADAAGSPPRSGKDGVADSGAQRQSALRLVLHPVAQPGAAP